MPADCLPAVKSWFHRTERRLTQRGFYDRYPLNEFWRKHNVPAMLEILKRSRTDGEALHRIQETFFFVITLGGEVAEATARWHVEVLKKRDDGFLQKLCAIGESPVVPAKLLVRHTVEGCRFSIDTFRIAAIASRIVEHFGLGGGGGCTFLELGPGLGHLARFMALLVPRSTYILCDLPLSLCFSYMFIRTNFPQTKCQLLDDPSQLTQEVANQSDFIFLPADMVETSPAVEVDVFINTCSLGEMRNCVSRRWFEFAQDRLRPTHFYSLNRFLNRIDDSPDYAWRNDENGQFSFFGSDWAVRDFSIGNERWFGPYLSHIHPRYAEIALSREGAKPVEEARAAVLSAAKDFLLHDWICLYRTHSWSITYHGAGLFHDLTKSGELFRYWDCFRTCPSALSGIMLLAYLDFLNLGNRGVFEETVFLEDWLLERSAHEGSRLGAALKEFVGLHRGVGRGQLQGVFERTAELVRMLLSEDSEGYCIR